MNLLDHMRIFVQVSRLGSFSAAAKVLEMPLPSVSRAISRLESHLNAVLLNRTTRRVEMTRVGQDFFEHCTHILRGVDDALQSVADSNVSPEGYLRVHAPFEIGKRYLIPAIAEYRQLHPSVNFDLVLENRTPNLAQERFDVALTTMASAPSGFASRNVGSTYGLLCASREYLQRHGEPRIPEDLAAHQCLMPCETANDASDCWAFEGPFGPVNVYLPPSSFQLNSADAIVQAVCSGMGIGCIPVFAATPLLQDGRLVQVLESYRLSSDGIHVVFPERLAADVCVRSWTAHLSNCLPRLLAQDMNAQRQATGAP